MAIAIVPILTLYVAFQKRFIEGISLGSDIQGYSWCAMRCVSGP
jgi:hypothetical protein